MGRRIRTCSVLLRSGGGGMKFMPQPIDAEAAGVLEKPLSIE
jgi:hypothetical protein